VTTLAVLLVVDTTLAIATGTLAGSCCMVNTNGYLGSWDEGTSSLHTSVRGLLAARVERRAVTAGAQIRICGFSGAMVDEAVCLPVAVGTGVWSGVVQTHGVVRSYGYTVTVSVESAVLSVECFLKGTTAANRADAAKIVRADRTFTRYGCSVAHTRRSSRSPAAPVAPSRRRRHQTDHRGNRMFMSRPAEASGGADDPGVRGPGGS